MTIPLKKLLTQEPTRDGKPLFVTAAALGGAIAALTDDAGYSNARSAGTLVAFVFRGKRACPAPLREAILRATRQRLSKQPKSVQDDWVQRVGRTIDFLNAQINEAQEQQSPPDEEQFGALIAQARQAKEQFIVTPYTAEEDDDMRQAAQLNKLLLELLGVCPPKTDAPGTSYCFLLPSKDKACDFWRNLKAKAERACAELGADVASVDARLRNLDGNNLSVYVVPRYVCGCPIVVFDPSSRFSSAFSFGYHDKNVIDAIQWDTTAVLDWKQNVLSSFRRITSEDQSQIEPTDMLNFFYGYRYYYQQPQES